ncbi:hypothetical protein BD560DRAFT_412090, partial [Blakeslea trispora]
GQGSIYDESDAKAMDIVDEKPDHYALKQLVNLDTHIERADVTIMNTGEG